MPKKEKTKNDILLEELSIDSKEDFKKFISGLTKAFVEKSLNAEFDEHIGYEKWNQNSREVSDNYRKGITSKKLKTENGEFDVEVPRDYNGTFEPQLVKKYQRNINGIEENVLKLYAKGLSTREIDETFQSMYGVDVSKDTISRITDKILPEITSWQSRPLDNIYPILMVDGIRFKVRDDGKYQEKSVYIVIGINMDGFRDVLGFWIAESESSKQWLSIFNDLKARGLKDVLIACSDNLRGISEAFKLAFPNTDIQKCVVHQIRNSIKHVRYDHVKEFTKDMKEIYKAPNIDIALNNLQSFDDKWGSKYGYAIKSWKDNIEELTTFFNYPFELRRLIYTTNVIENLNRNIRKITKTKGGFTTLNALTKIVYLRLLDISDDWTKSHIANWGLIINQLKIIFPDRLNDDIN